DRRRRDLDAQRLGELELNGRFGRLDLADLHVLDSDRPALEKEDEQDRHHVHHRRDVQVGDVVGLELQLAPETVEEPFAFGAVDDLHAYSVVTPADSDTSGKSSLLESCRNASMVLTIWS